MFNDYSIKIKSCGISDCNPAWQWHTNGFNDYDLWAVFRGKGEIFIGEERFAIEENSCFLLPPNTPIKAFHEPNNPLLVINLHFDFLSNTKKVEPFERQFKLIANPIFFKQILTKAVSSHYSNQPQSASTWLTSALYEFFSFANSSANNITENIHAKYINQICEQVNESVENASLNDFATKFGYTPTYLGKIFRKYTGLSFSQYLTNARINKAKLLLKTTELSISEIAKTLGYYDTSHFINQFKKEVKKSPNLYRKK